MRCLETWLVRFGSRGRQCECEKLVQPQRLGGYILFGKCRFTCDFVDEYLTFAQDDSTYGQLICGTRSALPLPMRIIRKLKQMLANFKNSRRVRG